MSSKILIVDDELLINNFLEVRLLKEGLEVDIAFDGLSASQKIQSNKYDLILTDLMLPFVAGVELIMRIKKSDLNAKTPIIVLSSLSADDVVIDVLSIGAQDYVIKPFSMNVVLAKIKQQLKINQSAA